MIKANYDCTSPFINEYFCSISEAIPNPLPNSPDFAEVLFWRLFNLISGQYNNFPPFDCV